MNIENQITELNAEFESALRPKGADNDYYTLNIESLINDCLLIYGSTGTYGHDLEIKLSCLDWVNLPSHIENPRFTYAGDVEDSSYKIIEVRADSMGRIVGFVHAAHIEVKYVNSVKRETVPITV